MFQTRFLANIKTKMGQII